VREPDWVVTLIDGSTLKVWDWIPDYGGVVRRNGVTIAVNLTGTAQLYGDAMPTKRRPSSNGKPEPELVTPLLAALADAGAKLADEVRDLRALHP
jgi:hypothetical protein